MIFSFHDILKYLQVFSSAKYPAEEKPSHYSSIYEAEGKTLEHLKHPNYQLETNHVMVDSRVLKEKLQFYNVHLNIKVS